MIPATEKQTEILSTFNNVRWAVFCGSSRLGSHKIYEPSRKSLSEWLTGLLWLYEIWVSCSIVSTTDKSIVWNWNGGSSISGPVLTSRLLTRLLTSGEEGIKRVSMRKEGTSSTACEFTMLILSISVTFNQCELFDCYIFNYEIMPATVASRFLFILQGSALADLRYGGRF